MRTILLCFFTSALVVPAVLGAQDACPVGSLPAYAHNDYENVQPLTDAVSLGFRGVEADLFLVDHALRVGHDREAARSGASLEQLYLQPLQALMSRCGRQPVERTPFLLALELKEKSTAAYDSLLSVLGRYSSLLEVTKPIDGHPPRLRIVLVGWHPTEGTPITSVDSMLGWQQRITLARPQTLPGERVRLLSIDYGKTMGRWWVTSGRRRRWLAAIRAAKDASPDCLVRAHNVPVDQRVYAELFAAGVDLIGTKQLNESAVLLAPSRMR